MGDSGDVEVDPAFPNIVVSTRGPQCTMLSSAASSPPAKRMFEELWLLDPRH
jgi:hypothetical protein